MASLTAVGSAAWGLYQHASRIQYIGSLVSYLLPYQDARIRGLLKCIARRVDCLAQPLNFCLLWIQIRGSCVSEIVFQAREIMINVENFVEECAQCQKEKKNYQDNLKGRLTDFLKDLDFALNSINIALNMINLIKTKETETKMSSTALLRASNKINKMHQVGGDVCIADGKLFAYKPFVFDEKDDFDNENKSDGEQKKNLVKNCYELRINSMAEAQESKVFTLNFASQIKLSNSKSVEMKPESCHIDYCLLWNEEISNQVQSRYCFVMSGLSPHDSKSPLFVRPIDLDYILKLCLYENASEVKRYNKSEEEHSLPSHYYASDEELQLLFGYGDKKVNPSGSIKEILKLVDNTSEKNDGKWRSMDDYFGVRIEKEEIGKQEAEKNEDQFEIVKEEK